MNLSSDSDSSGSFDMDLLDENALAAALVGIDDAPPAPAGYGYILPSQGLGPPRMAAPLPHVSLALGVPPYGRQWPMTAAQRPGPSVSSGVYVNAAIPLHHGPGLLQFSGPRMSLARPSPNRVDNLLAQRAALDLALADLVHNHTHNMALELAQETIWFDKWKCDDAEKQFHENQSGGGGHRGGGGAAVSTDVLNRITKLEDEKSVLQKTVSSMEKTITDLTKRLAALETGKPTTQSAPAEEEDDDDDVDLFGSDDEEEDTEAARVREERLAAYAAKKSKKPGPIAKSSVLLDCKPWDDETDMAAMEAEIRKIEMDGLKWGAGKLQPVGYGIEKLSILCTVEDEKVSIDELSETITEIEDYVQSVDIAAFNKI